MVTGNRKNRAHSGLWWWGGRVLHALDGIKGSFFLSFFFFFLNSDRWSRRIVGGTGKRKIDGGGRVVGFFEDFVERDRLLAIGWDCNAIEMRDERIWSGIIGDRGWIVVAVCSAGICSKYGEKGCLSLSWKLNCFRWALMENRPLPFSKFFSEICVRNLTNPMVDFVLMAWCFRFARFLILFFVLSSFWPTWLMFRRNSDIIWESIAKNIFANIHITFFKNINLWKLILFLSKRLSFNEKYIIILYTYKLSIKSEIPRNVNLFCIIEYKYFSDLLYTADIYDLWNTSSRTVPARKTNSSCLCTEL